MTILGTYLPRQLIAEKIKSASEKIPEGFGTPEMGPITTGLGEIYQYILDVKPDYEDQYIGYRTKNNSRLDCKTTAFWYSWCCRSKYLGWFFKTI